MTHREELALTLDLPRGRRHQPKLGLARRGSRGRRLLGPSQRSTTRRLQRSTVKAAYSPNRRPGQWRAHGRYLARPGTQRPAGKGVGFTRDREDVDLSTALGAWQAAGDPRLWKFIVSPEHGARLDLRAHALALAARMERDLGTRLEWVAIDHYSTGNPHVHLIVRGRDREDRPVVIARDYIRAGLRVHSQDLATRALGLRSTREILRSRAALVERAQLTELDRALRHRADRQGIVRYGGLPPRGRVARALRHQELGRLAWLEASGLAQRVGARTWRLTPTLEATLREAQLLGDIVKRRAAHLDHLTDPRLPVVFTRLTPGQQVTGRVVGTGLHDEVADRRYLLVEGTDGRLHYLLQTPAVERARGAGRVRRGDHITVTGVADERTRQATVRLSINRQRGGQDMLPDTQRRRPRERGVGR